MVLYSHYLNSPLSKDLGGCQTGFDPRLELGHVVPSYTQSSIDFGEGRVEHAVDDEELHHSQRMSQLTV